MTTSMSQLLIEFLKKRFARCGGGSNKHRCKSYNPSTAKIHGPLPTQEELHEFEQSYAGPNTPELMERYSGWSSGSIKRNKTCLICLKSTRGHERRHIICDTCPRTIHFDCLDAKAPHIGHEHHCPACVKRRWHIIRPVTHVQRQGQSDEDYYMQRTRRYHRWHRYNCEHINGWLQLHDDGSLESDRNLLMSMGVTKHKPVRGPDNAGDETDRGTGLDEERPEPGSDRPGEAAEYFNSNASRLGTAVDSIRSNLSHHSAKSNRSGNASQRPSNAQQTRGPPREKETKTAPARTVRSNTSGNGDIPVAISPDTETEHPPAPSSRAASINSRASGSAEHVIERASSSAVQISTDASKSGSTVHNSARGSVRSAGSQHSDQRSEAEKTQAKDEKSDVSSMPTNSMRSYRSNDSHSNLSRRSHGSGFQGTEVSRASTGATSDTSRHLDQRSRTDGRPA